MILGNLDLRLRLLKLAQTLKLYDKHAIFLADTNPYMLPNILDYANLTVDDGSASILDALLFIAPTFRQSSDDHDRLIRRKRADDGVPVSRGRRDNTFEALPEVNFIYDAIILVDEILTHNNDGDLQNGFQFGADVTFHLYSGEITIDSDKSVIFDFALFDVNLDLQDVTQVYEIEHHPDGHWQLINDGLVSLLSFYSINLTLRFHYYDCVAFCMRKW